MVWPPGGLCRQGLGSHVSERVVAGEYMKIPFVPCIFFLLSCVFIVGGMSWGRGLLETMAAVTSSQPTAH